MLGLAALRVLACARDDGWGAETKVRQARVRQKSRSRRCNGDGRAKANGSMDCDTTRLSIIDQREAERGQRQRLRSFRVPGREKGRRILLLG